MYPTLNPKPADVKEAFILVRNMWGALSDTEKEVRPFIPLHRQFRRGTSEGLLDRVPTLPMITLLAPSPPPLFPALYSQLAPFVSDDLIPQGFRSEARDISAQRKLVYDKWRHGLSQSDVTLINKYRKTGTKVGTKAGTSTRKPRKLGPDVLSPTKRRTNSFLKFSVEMRSTGQIDSSVAPEGVNKAAWFAKLAGARWRAMSDAEKKVRSCFSFTEE